MSFAHDEPIETGALPALPGPSLAGVEDYLALLKPRVMSLVVFTALVGLAVAPAHVHPLVAFASILCIAVGAGASVRADAPVPVGA